ncbi:NAD(P)-dependent oxidoreductase [Amycolatopsis thermoflava]|uniref:3-hydroxyisobutyrate dehydrogenase-like beta-hydroxyacid dehydrogenase n=1 Tax=Amycolatopsis thermoflava TaxID=84480 RepID=A0A3N2GRT6_9PSEU|nr:NAD(P)-binding domain-containing protein [Amycolatopsis thermoflava]ROS38635.1 3-hydroxyisobutyrate dehydrogenase-like beta-hydroxyacid dehydrogenase [Amycolatopsis thermoflava]
MTTHTPSTTVLGLGAMGTALARALLSAGHPVTVWNRTAAKADALVARGAARAASPAEAVAASPVVVACLLDYDSVREVLGTGNLQGRTIVNLTNGTPGQAREFAEWAACQGADYLDGGIMAVPPMIGSPAAFVLYSGSRTAFDRARPALDVFGESVYLGEDVGRAALTDIALLTGMYGMFGGILQSLALATSDGAPATGFAPMLTRWLQAMSGLVDTAAKQIDSGDYATGVVSNLGMQAAGFDNLLRTADEQGVSGELLAPLGRLMRQRAADGHAHEDVAGIIHHLRKDNA